ncbi:MAG: Ig-like domain-containing protein, partial [Candidatus Rokuibacteriota bacterium]
AWCAERVGHLNKLKALVGEIAALEPVLLADDAPGALSGNSQPGAIKTKVKQAGGKGYVFAYNATNAPVTATLTWNTGPGGVTVHGENRSVAASGRSFTDTFGPYQAHVYVLDTGGSGGATPPPPTAGAPTVTFTNPAGGATVSGAATVSMTASGGSGGYSYRLSVGGSTVYTGANGTTSWNTTTTANGGHTLTATVTDAAGQSGTATRSVTVSNTTTSPPPAPAPGGLTVVFTSPAAGATVAGRVVVNLWVEGQSGSSNTFTLSVGGQAQTAKTIAGNHAWLYWDSGKVVDGSHTLVATVRDAAGKTGTASRSVTTRNGVTSTPPPPSTLTASLTAPAAGATVSGTTTIGMAASGGTAGVKTFTLAVDGTTVSAPSVSGTTASFAWNTASVANGARTLALTVRDAAGATATATRTVTVANATTSPPAPPVNGGLEVFITSPRANATVSGSVVINLWVEGQSGSSNTYTVRLDGRVMGVKTSPGAHVYFTVPTTAST